MDWYGCISVIIKFPKIHVSKIAAIKGFYNITISAEGEESDYIETGLFKTLDTSTSMVISKLVTEKNPIILSAEEKDILSYFISFLHVRGPSYRQKGLNYKIAAIEEDVAKVARNPQAFKEDMEKAGVAFDSEEEFEYLRKQFADKITNHYDFAYERGKGQGEMIENMIESAIMLVPTIYHKKWELFECDSEVFITSDNPLTLMQPIEMPHSEVQSFLNLKIIMPVSPSRCLVLDNGPISNTIDVIQTDRQRVLNINRSTMFSAYREIYSNRNSRGIKKAFNRTKDGESEKVYIDGYDP